MSHLSNTVNGFPARNAFNVWAQKKKQLFPLLIWIISILNVIKNCILLFYVEFEVDLGEWRVQSVHFLVSDKFLLSDAARVIVVRLNAVEKWQNAYVDLVEACVHCRVVLQRCHHFVRKSVHGHPDQIFLAVRLAVTASVQQSAERNQIIAKLSSH